MINIYVRRIVLGEMAIEKVPEKWKNAVKTVLSYIRAVKQGTITVDEIPSVNREIVQWAIEQ